MNNRISPPASATLTCVTVVAVVYAFASVQPLVAQDPKTTVEFGGSTIGASTILLPAFGSDVSNCELTTTPEPYVVQPLAVDSTDVYEIRVVEAIDLSGAGDTDDTILTLYTDSLSTADPCAGFIAVGNVVVGEGLDAELVAGQQYELVVSGFLGSEDAYRLSIAGPPGRSIWLGQLGTGTDDVAETPVEHVDHYHVGALYPNPLSGNAEFSVAVSETQNVRIDVFDLLGRRIDALFDGHVAAGSALSVRIDGSTWSPGVYLVRVAGETFSSSQMVTRIR